MNTLKIQDTEFTPQQMKLITALDKEGHYAIKIQIVALKKQYELLGNGKKDINKRITSMLRKMYNCAIKINTYLK